MKFLRILASDKKHSATQRLSDSAKHFIKCQWILMVPLLFVLNACNKNEKLDTEKSYVTNLEKREGSCFENDIEGLCPFSTPQTDTLILDSIPGYPVTCTFTVAFVYVECNWGPTPTIYNYVIGSLELIDVNCTEYDDEIDDVLNNPGIGIPSLQAYMIDLYDKLQRRIEDKIFNPLYASFICDVSDDLYFVSWTSESCYYYCAFRTGSEGSFIAIRLPCGTGCCLNQVEMCWDPQLGRIIKTVTRTETQSGECDPPNHTPAYYCIQSSPCNFYCD